MASEMTESRMTPRIVGAEREKIPGTLLKVSKVCVDALAGIKRRFQSRDGSVGSILTPEQTQRLADMQSRKDLAQDALSRRTGAIRRAGNIPTPKETQ
jgi:hypothetical protein